MKTFSLLVVALCSQACGNVILSKAMKQLTNATTVPSESLISLISRAAETPAVWVGTLFLIVFFLLFSTALSWSDLSFVLPTASFGYVLNVATAHFFLSETISPIRWAGTILIALGVALVSRTSKERSTE